MLRKRKWRRQLYHDVWNSSIYAFYMSIVVKFVFVLHITLGFSILCSRFLFYWYTFKEKYNVQWHAAYGAKRDFLVIPLFFFSQTAQKSLNSLFVFCIFFLNDSNFDLIPRCLSNTFQNLWTGQSHIKNRQWVHVKSSLNLTERFYHSIWNEADKTYKRTKTQT